MSSTTGAAVDLRPIYNRIQNRALIIGGLGLALSIVGWFVDPVRFYRAYLFSYLYVLGFPIGCLALLMLQHLVHGRWGQAIRLPLESGATTVPLMALLFIPIAVGIPTLYEWASPEAAADPLLAHKSHYLNTNWFLARAVGYFVLWSLLAIVLNVWARRAERTGSPAPLEWSRLLSGPGLVLLVVSASFAMIDWFMSIEPHWYSSIYGLMLLMGMGLATYSAMVVVVTVAPDPGRRMEEPTHHGYPEGPTPIHDLGNLMLAFVMLWAYMAFSQFLIIWSGNLPEETPWYVRRTNGGWEYLALFLVVFQFFVPFLILLSRDVKREVRALVRVAAILLAVHLLESFWLIQPGFQHGNEPSEYHFTLSWLDFVTPVGLVGIWLAAFVWSLKGHPPIPLHDEPEAAPAHGHGPRPAPGAHPEGGA